MTNRQAIAMCLGLLGTALALPGTEGPETRGPKQSLETSSTKTMPFEPGGTIRINRSYGYLAVEGWDRPEVGINVIKSMDRLYAPDQQEDAAQRFEQVRLDFQRRSDNELEISTALPVRNSLFSSVLPSGEIVASSPLPPRNKRGITVEQRIYVPRDSRLIVLQDNGYVWVSDVTGDIEVKSHTGDMVVVLPDTSPYSIDARTGLGSVSSDFTGRTLSRFLLGTRFTYTDQAPARRIYLRMGRGSITVKKGLPSGPFWNN